MAKQLELLKSNCIELIPENLLDKVLKISGLSKLEMNLMLGNVPKEYEESYLDNISVIPQLLTARESVNDNKKANVEFQTAKGELYHADCLEILPLIQSESVDLIFADPPFNLKKNMLMEEAMIYRLVSISSGVSYGWMNAFEF